MSLNAGTYGGNGMVIAKSMAVIGALEYLRSMIANVSEGVAGVYSQLVARAVITYLEFAAYQQGWIQVPSGGVM